MEKMDLDIFKHRFRDLVGDNITDFSNRYGFTRQAIGFFYNGDRRPNIKTLHEICEKCGVSSDWLLGLSDVRSPDADMQAVCEFTGLSETAVNVILRLKENGYIEALSFLLSHEKFSRVPHDMECCKIDYEKKAVDLDDPESYARMNEIRKAEAWLRKRGLYIMSSTERARMRFSDRSSDLFLIMQEYLFGKDFDEMEDEV